jgi:hypothetical protein
LFEGCPRVGQVRDVVEKVSGVQFIPLYKIPNTLSVGLTFRSRG